MDLYHFSAMRYFFPIALGLFVACQKAPESKPVPNLPPETFLFVEGTVDTVGARQVLYWYGNDPDGYVVGYEILVDDTNWANATFTTARSDTFTFAAAESVIVHTVQVRAMDNEGAVDPTPAQLILPVTNTPPEVSFQFGTLPPDTTLPVATFFFEGHDIDGDETITGYLWRLDTETTWHLLPPESTSVTILGIEPGERTFVLRAVDEAQALSDSITHTWTVLPARGRVLLVKDDLGEAQAPFYREVLEGLGIEYTEWHVGRGLPFAFRDVYHTLNSLGFEVVLWFTGDSSHAVAAELALEDYLSAGNKLLLVDPHLLDPMVVDPQSSPFPRNVLGVDTVVAPNKFLIQNAPIPGGYPGYPDTLYISAPILSRFDGFYVDTALSAPLYFLPDSAVSPIPPQWPPQTAVALRSPKNAPQANLVFFSIPLSGLNGQERARDALIHILRSEFGL